MRPNTLLGAAMSVAVSLSLSTAFAQTPGSLSGVATTSVPAPQAVLDAFDVTQGTVQQLALLRQGGQFVVAVEIEGQGQVLEFAPINLLSPSFQLLYEDEFGMHQMPTPEQITYRGVVRGDQGSGVAATVVNGVLDAMVWNGAGDKAWGIQALSSMNPAAAAGQYIVYAEADVDMHGHRCGVEENGEIAPPNAPGISRRMNQTAEIAFDCDFEFYQLNGSNVTNTMADTMRVLNAMDFIYARDTMINYLVTTIIVRTNSNDPYTSTASGTRLSQFQNHWISQQGSVQRDVAALMTVCTCRAAHWCGLWV